MTELIAALPAIDRIGAVTTLIVVAVLVITDKLVWHTRLKAAQGRAERWEGIALDLLVSAKASVQAAEVTAHIVAGLPDPQGVREQDERDKKVTES
jgi:hypothetical protein